MQMADARGRSSRERLAEREATLETIAKLAEGPLSKYEKSGFLGADHIAAAFCIEEGYQAKVGPVGLRMMGWTGVGTELKPESLSGYLSEIRERLVRAYDRWLSDLEKDKMIPQYQTVMDVMAGDTMARIEARNGWHNRKGKLMLREGLQRYCDLNPFFLGRHSRKESGSSAAAMDARRLTT